MNDFAPPETDLYALLDEEEDEEERNRIFFLIIVQQERRREALERQRKRRQRKMDPPSSDSEVDEVTKGVKDGKMDVTPAESEPPQELVKLDPSEIGMMPGLKHLYSGKEDKRGRFQWESKIPEDLGQPAEDAESQKYAIIARKVKVYNDPTKVLTLHSIVVQSPLLKELLKQVLSGYPGVTVNLKRLEFSGKFEPLIHRYRELNEAIVNLKLGDEADSKTKAEHAELLQKLLAEEFKDTIEATIDMKGQGVMTYEHLWTIFQPGSFIYSKQQGQDRIFKLVSSRYGHDRNSNPVFWLTCQYVDYDGSRFGTQKLNLKIPAFEGTKSITSLQSYPLDNHHNKEELKTRLIERGTKIESFSGCYYRQYNGIGWRLDSMGNKDSQFVKGRIVIDTYGWNRFNPNYSIYVSALHTKDNTPASGMGGSDNSIGSYESDYDDYDDDDGGMPPDGFFADEDDDESKKPKLSDEQKMMCTPLVRGYAFKEKMWLNFFVNAVQEVTFNESAFDSLVLPGNKKEIIYGFISTHQNHMTQFDDVIQGKGRGIILLLCGPPGVGKTLTAESVAEEMKVPLYQMSAGDLGLDPRHVESKLQGILDMCTRWNAILLLDEADVFLEERSLHELERNKLVSIFLRVLEYYEGIMFLTTNRVQTFDQAFQSRIHISLDYKELDAPSRKRVWTNFLDQHNIAQAAARERPPKPTTSAAKSNETAAKGKASRTEEEEEARKQAHLKRTEPHAMSEKDITKLARLQMNGRQIKNILKAAQMLATRKEEGLSYQHVEMVMDVTQHLHQTTLETERTRASFFS